MEFKNINVRVPLWVYTQFVCKLRSEKGIKAALSPAVLQLMKDDLGRAPVLEPRAQKLNVQHLYAKALKEQKRKIDDRVVKGRHYDRTQFKTSKARPALLTKTELRKIRLELIEDFFRDANKRMATKKAKSPKPHRKTKRKCRRNRKKSSRIHAD